MKKGITLVLSVVGIILFLVFQLQAQKNVVMAVPVVKEAVYESIKESRTPVQNLTRAELQIGAVTAAWEETVESLVGCLTDSQSLSCGNRTVHLTVLTMQ